MEKEKGEILDSVIRLSQYVCSYAAQGRRQRAGYAIVGQGVVKDIKVTLVENQRAKRRLKR